MNLVEEMNAIIHDISAALGKPIPTGKYEIVDRGVPHIPKSLPTRKMGIYLFWFNGQALKIGKAGPNSNARFLSQHYNPRSAQSTLAASLLLDDDKEGMNFTEDTIGEWIKSKCRRIDIILDADLGIFSLELIEAILHYRYEPTYEGFFSQR